MDMYEIAERCKAYGVTLSHDMPVGYETAFGTYDVTKNTLFLNIGLQTEPEHIRDFYFYHEFRHAYQYTHRCSCSKDICETLDYVILYNGECYKLSNNEWKQCKLEGSEEFFTNAYLSLPYELDANEYAYGQCVAQYPSNKSELMSVYESWLPAKRMTMEELKKVLRQIDNAL